MKSKQLELGCQVLILFGRCLDHCINDMARVVTVPDENSRWTNPGENVGDTDGDILGISFVEDPQFACLSGSRHAMAIVIDKTAVDLAVFAQANERLLELFRVDIWVSFELYPSMRGRE